MIDLEPLVDERGFFARSYCQRDFAAHGINFEIVQSNLSFNLKAGTLRGLHFQKEPAGEAKLVRCVQGSMYDVIVDLRAQSPTYGRSFNVELTAVNHRALFIPMDLAHGFQTLTDQTMVSYEIGEYYCVEAASGIRYDDPVLGLSWPLPVCVVSERDLAWPPLAS